MRWGLVCIAVLVGTVGLSQGLGWYFDPMRQLDRTTEAVSATRPPSRKPSGTAARPLPFATIDELSLLRAGDPAVQLKGAETLLAREISPDLVRTVERALQAQPDPAVERVLVCIKTRFQDPDLLEFLLARFPKDRKDLAWNLTPDVSCVLDALVERVTDEPERISAALMPGIYASNASTRLKVLKAFRTIDLPEVPIALVTEASTSGTPFQREALAAAMALGAMRQNPALVARAIRDPHTSVVVKEELRMDPHPNAARIVANVWAERSFETRYEELARAREGQLHDVSAGLLEVLGASSEPELKRIAAARQLGILAEVGPLRDLRALTSTLEPGDLKRAVDATIRVLQERRKGGTREQMRTLPQ